MAFWIEDPTDPDTYWNIDVARECKVIEREPSGRATHLVIRWIGNVYKEFRGFLARQIHTRICGNVMKASDGPKVPSEAPP